MSNSTKFLIYKISVWCGIVYGLIFIFFWYGLAHFWSPILPDFTLPQITDWMNANRQLYLIGLAVTIVGASLHVPWTAYVGLKMAEVEGKFPLLSIIQVLGGCLTVAVLSFPLAIWIAAGYWEDTAPETIKIVNGMAWMTFDMTFALTTVQNYAFGIVFLSDKRPQPLFPKWICWLSILAGTFYFFIAGIPFTKTGPFSWYGILAYWVAYQPWLLWFMAGSVYMLKDINRQISNEGAGIAVAQVARTATGTATGVR